MKQAQLIFLFCILFSTMGMKKITSPPSDKFDDFYFFYVDNSLSKEYGSLSPSIIEVLNNNLENIKPTDKSKFFLFLSNDNSPTFTNKYVNYQDAIRTLSGSNSYYPSVNIDKNLIRQKVYKNSYSLSGKIHFEFFLTERFAKEMLLNNSDMRLIGWFPKEIRKSFSTQQGAEVEVKIYYMNATKSIKNNDVLVKLNYLNKLEKNINYQLYEIQ